MSVSGLDSKKIMAAVKISAAIGIIGFFLPYLELKTHVAPVSMSEMKIFIEYTKNNIAEFSTWDLFICYVPVVMGVISLALAFYSSFGYSGIFSSLAAVALFIEQWHWADCGYSSDVGWYVSFIAFIVSAGWAYYGLIQTKKE